MGVDPGTARVGWGIIEETGGKIAAKAYGCITTEKNTDPGERLSLIYDAMILLLKKYKPEHISVEDLFFTSNTTTAIAVGQARGVILLAAAKHKFPVISYTPSAVKKTITGSGNADKAQVGKMITKLLRLKSVPTPDDTADALAIAATHGYSYKMKRMMGIGAKT